MNFCICECGMHVWGQWEENIDYIRPPPNFNYNLEFYG